MPVTFSNSILNPERVVKLLQDREPYPIPIFDKIITPDKIDTHDFASIAVDINTGNVVNTPVVYPGTPAVPLNAGSRTIRDFRPAPLNLSERITSADFGTIRDYEGNGYRVEKKRSEVLFRMVSSMRASRQAMLAEALRGTYSYPIMNSSGGIVVESRTYGSVQNPGANANYLDAVGADLTYLRAFWNGMVDAIKAGSNEMFGWNSANLICLCGADVWACVCEILKDAYPMNPPKPFMENGLETLRDGMMTFVNATWNYKTFTTNAAELTTKFITAKNMTMVDLSAGHMMRYCAIDDLQANGMGKELFVTEEWKSNPSSLEICAKQTPFIFADVRGIATDVVLT